MHTIFLTVFLILCIHGFVCAETIILKSGKTVEGTIIEKTDQYVKVDCYGVGNPYFLDEIKSIDGMPVSLTTEKAVPVAQKQARPFVLSVGSTLDYQGFASLADIGKDIDLSKGVPMSLQVKITGKERLGDTEVFIRDQYGGLKGQESVLNMREYISVSGSSLLCHKREIYSKGKKISDETFDPAITLIRLDVQPGFTWNVMKGVTITFVGKELVDLPLGKFEAYSFDLAAVSQGIEQHVMSMYDPQIGLIRELTVIKDEKGTEATALDLVHSS
ncbi:MAG TPA: hypothetical protein PKL77_00140 [Candidatus Omnitrophota bacterium]|nr:hypothetical protein [Candidatus Omnitrophota bacterium]HPT06670.1 hypothetical protein [Candidatus Omnitrophota bacterium]